MPYAYADYLSAIQRVVKNKDTVLDDPQDYENALDIARMVYSRYKPLEKLQSYSQTVADNRIFLLPTDWDNEFSLKYFRVEYPVDLTVGQDTKFDPNMVEIYLDAADQKWKFRFRDTLEYNPTPTVNTTFNFRYVIPHSLIQGTPDIITIPGSHFWPVIKAGAAELCKIKWVHYAGLGSANAGGDSMTDYQGKANFWKGLATQFWEDFAAEIIPKQEEQKPAWLFASPTDNPLHHKPFPLWGRDTDGRKNVYN